jgi:hypothetical protein
MNKEFKMPVLNEVGTFLNKKTDYLINWNRVGNLLFSNHRYSPQELIVRGFVVTCTAAGGFLAWNNSEKGGAMPFLLGASLAWTLAHAVVISPLVYKRLKAKWGCKEHIKSINDQLNEQDNDFTQLVYQTIDKILSHASEKSPSAVWGKRERLLNNLQRWIEEQDSSILSDVLKDKDIISKLDTNIFPEQTDANINGLVLN